VIEAPDAFGKLAPRAGELRVGLGDPSFLVVAPGDMNEAKRLDAVARAAMGLGEGAHVAIVGRRIEGYAVEPVVEAARAGRRVSVHADVTDADFLAWLAAADAVVDLRFPHRGEVSGSLARAMQCGRATIVSGTGTYLDVSGDRVVHVSPGLVEPQELAAAIAGLLEDDDRRRLIGEAARAHMAELASSEATAHAYARAIDGTLALLQDPSRRALARWGGALVDLGVTEADLDRGYGASYARALDEFAVRDEVPGR
jgi:glycosyltransferase involved in cell wall biosynthesis